MSRGDFVFDVGQHIDINFLHATIVKRYRNDRGQKTYDYKCDKCGCVTSKVENQVEKGIGCGVCSGRIVVKGVNDIPTTAPWMIPYFPGGSEEASNYTRSSGKEFYPICPYCGRRSNVKTSPNNLERLHRISCICKDGISIPNKVIRALMEQALNLALVASYEVEAKEVDEKGVLRKFDAKFCSLNGQQFFIEMDGGYHGNVVKAHSTDKFVALPAKMFYPDLMKDNIAEKLGIPLIRIDCYKSDVDYIANNIYASELSNLIDLDQINWEEIKNVCVGSIMTNVCKRKHDDPEITADEVAKEYKISASAVRKYWNKGVELGLCEYDSKAEGKKWMSGKKDWKQSVPILVKNVSSGQEWQFQAMSEFTKNSENIVSCKITKSMLEKRFSKSDNNRITYINPSTNDELIIIKINKE